jgi:hypothetical protein
MRARPKVSRHCGVCSQCIDRRFGSLAAGLQQCDLVERYGVDIFTQELKEGDQRTQCESYVRFALNIDSLSDDGLFTEYPQLYDCIAANDPHPPSTAHRLAALMRRHSREVLDVVEKQIQDHVSELLRGSLPETCLIRLVSSGEHLRDLRNVYITKVAEMLRTEIPKAFQSDKPKDERQLQDVAESLLSAARTELDREVPLLPFAGISTKPDFSKQQAGALSEWLFIEMKYVKTRQRVNGIITELTSRIYIYQQQDAYALFCVYDPYGYLRDKKAITDLTKDSQKCMVDIIR